jgi:hypothetical protein
MTRRNQVEHRFDAPRPARREPGQPSRTAGPIGSDIRRLKRVY